MTSIHAVTPLAGHGLLFVSSGYFPDSRRPTYAIKPGAAGDISLKGDEQSNEFVAWSHPTLASAYPSPLIVGDQYYTLMDRGFVTSNDPKTGREIYGRQRIAADGGHVFVVAVVLQREDLRGERGRRHVRDAGRSRIQGARAKRAGRDDAGEPRRRQWLPDHADSHEAVSHRHTLKGLGIRDQGSGIKEQERARCARQVHPRCAGCWRRNSTISSATFAGCSCCAQCPAPSRRCAPRNFVHAVVCMAS